MTIEQIDLGPTPGDEPCAQVGTPDYEYRGIHECEVYRDQLYRFLVSRGYTRDTLPHDFRIKVKAFEHDFGTYHEVVVRFNADDEKSYELVSLIENEGPSNWDDEAKEELKPEQS